MRHLSLLYILSALANQSNYYQPDQKQRINGIPMEKQCGQNGRSIYIWCSDWDRGLGLQRKREKGDTCDEEKILCN